jgi:hypothetical protein
MIGNAIHSIATNPIFVRLTRRGISLEATLWIGLGSLLFSLVVGSTFGLMWMDIEDPLIFFITAPISLLLVIYPPIVVIFATLITASDVQNKDHTMLKLTRLSPQQIVIGYVFAALYRLRVLHAIVIGLSFLAVFEWVSMSLSENASMLSFPQIGVSMAIPLIGVFQVVGRGLLGVSLGVALSLLWRQHGPAVIGAAAVVIVLQVVGSPVSYLSPYLIMICSVDIDTTLRLVSTHNMGYGILWLILVYLPSWGTMRLAQRWV